MYEGEVTELTPEYTEAAASGQGAGAGYGKVVSHVIIGLKTVKGTKQLKLDPTIYDSLTKEKVQVSYRDLGRSWAGGCKRSHHLPSDALSSSTARGRDLHRGQQRSSQARRTLRRLCHRVRSRGGGVRAPAKGGCA